MIDINATFLGIDLFVYVVLAILLIPSYYLWKWIIKKLRGGKESQWGALLATITTTPMIYCIGIYIWLMIASYYPSHDFDQNKWKENKEIRYEYTDDIIDNKLLIGKTKREVIDMLGNEAHDISSDIWYYYVGYVPGIFGIDPDYLVVEFKDDKVVNVYQYTS